MITFIHPSHKRGDVVAWASDFDYFTQTYITSNNQIFAAKLSLGSSHEGSLSYVGDIERDVETWVK